MMGKSSWRGIWEMLAALVFYDLVTTAVMMVWTDGAALAVQGASALVTGAVLSFLYIRKKKENRVLGVCQQAWPGSQQERLTAKAEQTDYQPGQEFGKKKHPMKQLDIPQKQDSEWISRCWRQVNLWTLWKILPLVVLGILLSLSINGLIDLTNLKSIFPGYRQTAQAITAPPLWLQVLAAGVVIPWTEELIFRGFGFSQLRRSHSFWIAAGISALAFGLYHGSVVQGLYAAVIGLFLAWIMEKKNCLMAPWLVHVSANLTSVLGGNVVKLKEWTVGVSILFLAILVYAMEKSEQLAGTHELEK